MMKEAAIAIVRRLQAAGHVAYFAGGCVRDMLRGVPPHDFDIATDATPDRVQQLFPHTIPVGAQFGVVLVLEGGHQFEVATFRRDDRYEDGRRPVAVHFGTAAEDAQRRDFTINGLFYDPVTDQVLDFVGGREDIVRRIVRTIGEPQQRFAEDKLRMLRAVRFATSLDFQLDPATLAAIQQMADEIRVVSAERIREELVKIFTRPNPGRGLELLDQSGLLTVILPEVAAMKGIEQPSDFHPEGDVFTHVKLMLDAMPPNPSVELAFAVLLHDVGKPPTFQRAPDRIRFNEHERVGADMTREIMQRLRFPNEVIDTVVACVAGHMRIRHAQEMRPGKLKQLLARPTFPIELELHRLDCLASHGSLDNYQFLQRKAAELPADAVKPAPLVTGHDLLALGAQPGPLVGQILREIEERQLDDELTTREAALEYAAKRLRTAIAKPPQPPTA